MTTGVDTRVLVDEVVPERAPWAGVVARGNTMRIVDLGGNQAVDFLVYNERDPSERYSASDTIVAQRNIFLVPGSVLLSNEGAPMMTLIGRSCCKESNTLRYGFHTKHQQACV